jgi:hypothetical protein
MIGYAANIDFGACAQPREVKDIGKARYNVGQI